MFETLQLLRSDLRKGMDTGRTAAYVLCRAEAVVTYMEIYAA